MQKIISWFLAAASTTLIILAGALMFALSACSAERTPPEHAVKLDTLLALERGTSLESVRTALGMMGKHEFSVLLDETKYLCLYFAFEKPRVGFYLIFTNEHLKAVVDPPKSEFNRVPYKDTYREVPKPFDAENRLKDVVSASDLRREEIAQRIRKAIPNGQESLNVLPAFIIASPLFVLRAGEMETDYRTNAELAKKYDPLKITVGAEAADVAKEFGAPYRVIKTTPESVIHVYGNPVNLRINPAYRFSWVAVVFKNGKVIRVLSNHFFDRRLLESQ